MKERTSKWIARHFNILLPLALLVLCLTAFGLLSPWLSHYWDDWPKTLFAETIGLKAFTNFAVHRPLNGWWYILSLSLLGTAPFRWHLYILFWRWASALAFWWFLKKLWPSRGEQLAWAAMLFLIYPGFLQGSIALSYYIHFLALTTFFLSFGFTLWAIRSERRKVALHSIAFGLSAITMLTTDYYYGLELLRPLAIFFVVGEQQAKLRLRISKTAKEWFPYFLLVVALFLWRLTINAAESYPITIIENILAGGFEARLNLFWGMLLDLVEGSLAAWAQTISVLLRSNWASRVSQFALVLMLGSATLFYAFLFHGTNEREKDKESKAWAKQAAILGGIALIVGNLPAWASGLPISLHFPANRLTLPMAAGAALLLSAIIYLILRERRHQVILISILIGLAVGLHFQTSNAFREDGEAHTAFWQQFTWRVPGLRPGTAVLSEEIPLDFYSDDSLTGALNIIYPSDNPAEELSAALFFLDLRLGSKIPALEADQAIHWDYRLVEFNGSTSQAIVIYHAPPACLRILDPVADADFPFLPSGTRAALKLSSLENINKEAEFAGHLPENLFTTSSEETWCYYFQKADLARQFGDWDRVAELGDIAFQLDDSPNHASERIPFIEGYAYIGRWSRAVELSQEAFDINNQMENMLCNTWERIKSASPASEEKESAIEQLERVFSCLND